MSYSRDEWFWFNSVQFCRHWPHSPCTRHRAGLRTQNSCLKVPTLGPGGKTTMKQIVWNVVPLVQQNCIVGPTVAQWERGTEGQRARGGPSEDEMNKLNIKGWIGVGLLGEEVGKSFPAQEPACERDGEATLMEGVENNFVAFYAQLLGTVHLSSPIFSTVWEPCGPVCSGKTSWITLSLLI